MNLQLRAYELDQPHSLCRHIRHICGDNSFAVATFVIIWQICSEIIIRNPILNNCHSPHMAYGEKVGQYWARSVLKLNLFKLKSYSVAYFLFFNVLRLCFNLSMVSLQRPFSFSFRLRSLMLREANSKSVMTSQKGASKSKSWKSIWLESSPLQMSDILQLRRSNKLSQSAQETRFSEY